MTNTFGTNTGHGHVWARPDGMKARCGGPAMCNECAKDAVQNGWRRTPDDAPVALDKETALHLCMNGPPLVASFDLTRLRALGYIVIPVTPSEEELRSIEVGVLGLPQSSRATAKAARAALVKFYGGGE